MLGEKQSKNFRARGSVGKSLRHERRMKDINYKSKLKIIWHESYLRRKKKLNNRCPSCNKLIRPESTYCNSCKDN